MDRVTKKGEGRRHALFTLRGVLPDHVAQVRAVSMPGSDSRTRIILLPLLRTPPPNLPEFLFRRPPVLSLRLEPTSACVSW